MYTWISTQKVHREESRLGEFSVKIIWVQDSKSKFLLAFDSTPQELGDQLTQ